MCSFIDCVDVTKSYIFYTLRLFIDCTFNSTGKFTVKFTPRGSMPPVRDPKSLEFFGDTLNKLKWEKTYYSDVRQRMIPIEILILFLNLQNLDLSISKGNVFLYDRSKINMRFCYSFRHLFYCWAFMPQFWYRSWSFNRSSVTYKRRNM
jgi:hypothetical protein